MRPFILTPCSLDVLLIYIIISFRVDNVLIMITMIMIIIVIAKAP